METKRYEIDRIDVLNMLKGIEGCNMPPLPMIELIESGIATWNQTECAGWHFNEKFLINVDVSIGFATYKKIKRHCEELRVKKHV